MFDKNGTPPHKNSESMALPTAVPAPSQNTAHNLEALYQNWFLDYASYVVLERAIPALEDGLKPVQRRILHAMKVMDDGRFHKVANVIGQTMQYHPHGDAAIGDALVHLGQKELLLETQGNWGDTRTGDAAAAPRYIEARLSKFALEVAFNADITQWQLSYDGRKNEPIVLPMKFPLLLAQGVEGIAVGLATKILPHNFLELLDASIAILKGEPINLLPDFPSGGMADFTNYNEGKKGSRVRVRAKIDVVDRSTLVIREIPYGVTTTAVIESIVKANDDGKIKIKHIVDNTAQNVEIVIEVPSDISPLVCIDALYAFTDCEVSISPMCCVICQEKPRFLSVHELLRLSTQCTVDLLGRELEVNLHELEEKWHFAMLERNFIETRLYHSIETSDSEEAAIATITAGLQPFARQLKRAISGEDIHKLMDIRIKRITRYDARNAEKTIQALEQEMSQLKHNLSHLTDYSIAYFQALKEKYGKGRARRTVIRTFETIAATDVAVANQKLYVNRKEGFVGYGLKKDEFVCDCSDLDDIIIFLKNGVGKVMRVTEKSFVGKDIVYTAVWKKNDSRMVYNMVYKDGASGVSFVKRFSVTAVTREKEYDLTQGTDNSKLLYFRANPNGETEVITVHLSPNCAARNKEIEFDFATIDIKGRDAKGNILTKYPVSRITHKTTGTATFGAAKIWYDPHVGRLNTSGNGALLGTFQDDDMILVITRDGAYQLTSFEMSNRYDAEQTLLVEKYTPELVVTAVYFDGEKRHFFVKRFHIETKTCDKKFKFIGEHAASNLVFASTAPNPCVKVEYNLKRGSQKQKQEIVSLADVIEIKGWKSLGNRLSTHEVASVTPVAETEPAKMGEVPASPAATEPTPKKPAQEEMTEKGKEKTKPPVAQDLFWDVF